MRLSFVIIGSRLDSFYSLMISWSRLVTTTVCCQTEKLFRLSVRSGWRLRRFWTKAIILTNFREKARSKPVKVILGDSLGLICQILLVFVDSARSVKQIDSSWDEFKRSLKLWIWRLLCFDFWLFFLNFFLTLFWAQNSSIRPFFFFIADFFLEVVNNL